MSYFDRFRGRKRPKSLHRKLPKSIFLSLLAVAILFSLVVLPSFSGPVHASRTFIYVSDAGNFDKGPWKIVRYDENGENPVDFITEGLSWPQDIVFLEEKNEVLISNLKSGEINRHDAETGEMIGLFAHAIGPTRMKIRKDTLVYVLQWSGNGKVLRFDREGSLVDEFTQVGVVNAIGMDWDAKDYLYVSSYKDANIRKFDQKGRDMGLFIDSHLKGPTNIWFDGQGNLLVNDWSANRVVRFDSVGNFIDNYIITGLNQPEGVDFLKDGSLLIGSGGTSEIVRYGPGGTIKGSLVTPGRGGLKQPNAIRVRTAKSR